MNKLNFVEIKNKTVLLRCDFNEPIKENILLSTRRIDASINTIQELSARNNNIILISHHSDEGQNMSPIYNYLKKSFPYMVYLNTTKQENIKEYFLKNKKNKSLSKITLLENTRLFSEEENLNSKNLDESNNLSFAKFLASLGEVFIYDAFSVAHRDHASTTGIAKILMTCFGNTFLKEYDNLKKILDKSEETIIIMGGAKLSTKLKLVQKFLNKKSIICLGGAMIHEILKHKNIDIGDSYLEKDFELEKDILVKLNLEIEKNNLILPTEIIWEGGIVGTKIIDNIFDAELLRKIIQKNNIKNILWNGPVGMYENGAISGSKSIYDFIKNSNKEMFSVVGGGDTLTMLENVDVNFENNFSYISLSGGAMLTFLSEGTLPILNIIKINKS